MQLELEGASCWSSDDSDSSGEATDSASDSEMEERVACMSELLANRDDLIDLRRFESSKGRIHAGRPGSRVKTKCGKDIENFTQLAVGTDEAEGPKCMVCFGLVGAKGTQCEDEE